MYEPTTTRTEARFLPVGTEVLIRDTDRYGRRLVRKIGTPVVLESGEVVCRYRDVIQAWDHVQPTTHFDVVRIPAGKKLHKALEALNASLV